MSAKETERRIATEAKLRAAIRLAKAANELGLTVKLGGDNYLPNINISGRYKGRRISPQSSNVAVVVESSNEVLFTGEVLTELFKKLYCETDNTA